MPETRTKPGIRAKMLEIKAYVDRDPAENVSNQSKCVQRKGKRFLKLIQTCTKIKASGNENLMLIFKAV